MEVFDFRSEPRLVFGPGTLSRLGELARELGFRRTLFVSDPGIMATAHAERALDFLRKEGIEVVPFSEFGESPDTVMVERGRAFAENEGIDSLIGLGGGSSLDCAKGINFLLTNGGRISDYRGFGRAREPLLPMIGVPTTAGTGSEAQSYALISDTETHVKMACGDFGARFRVAIVDPELTLTQPREVTAISGYDALAHAVETYVTKKRNPLSDLFSREAFRLLSRNYERVLADPDDLEARAAMHLGAFYAGVAIENSMLGATHACANPLTRLYGTTHGRAIALCLSTVVRFNAELPEAEERYRELLRFAGYDGGRSAGETLASLLGKLAIAAGLSTRLRDDGIPETDIDILAREASEQWTGTFNPRPFDESTARDVYRAAY